MSALRVAPIDPAWAARVALLDEFKPHLRRKALEARLKAFHYDGFLVGAAALGFGIDNKPKVLYGSNYKDAPGTEGPRVCAEEEVMAHSLLRGCIDIVGIVIAAAYKPDDHSGGDLDGCLIPCRSCREKFASSVGLGDSVRRRTYFESMRIENRNGREVVTKTANATIGGLLAEFPI